MEPELNDAHKFLSTAKLNVCVCVCVCVCVKLLLLFPHTSLQFCAELNTKVTCYSYTVASM
jgi:hypothetical protein